MPYEITTINRMGVNCYIIHTESGFFMVDSGLSFSRKAVNEGLIDAGCRPGELKLVVLTHGDIDHTGNCIFLRKEYNAKIAVQQGEAKALEKGSIAGNRKRNRGIFFRVVLAPLWKLIGRPFKPDVFLSDNEDLSQYGLNARVIYTPGHTMGSISILTAEEDFFCGDFLSNRKVPRVNSLVDDAAEMAASLAKLKTLSIRKIYPGHGPAFTKEELLKNIE